MLVSDIFQSWCPLSQTLIFAKEGQGETVPLGFGMVPIAAVISYHYHYCSSPFLMFYLLLLTYASRKGGLHHTHEGTQILLKLFSAFTLHRKSQERKSAVLHGFNAMYGSVVIHSKLTEPNHLVAIK